MHISFLYIMLLKSSSSLSSLYLNQMIVKTKIKITETRQATENYERNYSVLHQKLLDQRLKNEETRNKLLALANKSQSEKSGVKLPIGCCSNLNDLKQLSDHEKKRLINLESELRIYEHKIYELKIKIAKYMSELQMLENLLTGKNKM